MYPQECVAVRISIAIQNYTATEYRITATEYRITAIESRITAYAVCIHLEIVRNSEKYLLGLTPVARRNNILISPFSKYV